MGLKLRGSVVTSNGFADDFDSSFEKFKRGKILILRGRI